MTVGIITYEGYKDRTIAIAKGYRVPHPQIKHYAMTKNMARKKFGPGLKFINLNKLPIILELK